MDPLRRQVVLPQVSSSVPCALESSGFLVVAPSFTKFVRERRCEEERFFEINQGRIEQGYFGYLLMCNFECFLAA